MPPVTQTDPTDRPRRSVLIIGSEALPFSKTGGLADVLGALPPALARLGWDATVVLPRYRGVTAGALVETFPVTVGGYTRDVGFFEAPLADGARALLVDCPDLYDRDGAVRRRQRRLSRQPAAVRVAGARRARVRRAARARRRRSSTRTTGRRASRRSI